MGDYFPTQEKRKEISRDQVIGALHKFVEQGIKSPDSLDLEDAEVKAVNDLSSEWMSEQDALAQDNPEAMLRNNLAKTMLYVDAGFTDPGYLDEVLHDWLILDAQDAEKQPDNPARVETRQMIIDAIKKIRSLLKEQKN